MGISVSSKKGTQTTKQNVGRKTPNSVERLDPNLTCDSHKRLSFSSPDSGYPTCTSTTDAGSRDIMNTTFSDIGSIDDYIYTIVNENDQTTGKRGKQDDNVETSSIIQSRSSSMIQENGIDLSFIIDDDFQDCESLRTLNLPGVVINTEAVYGRDKDRHTTRNDKDEGRERARNKSSTIDPQNRPRAASVEGHLQRQSSRQASPGDGQYQKTTSANKHKALSSDNDGLYLPSKITGNTSNPDNRPKAARADHRPRTQSSESDMLDAQNDKDDVKQWASHRYPCSDRTLPPESPVKEGMESMDAFLLLLRDRPSLFSDYLTPGNDGLNSKKSSRKCELKVTVNPSSDVCEISLPGALIFNGLLSDHGQRRTRST